jgi:glycosyltransferase involved in cell wall biosynthesis
MKIALVDDTIYGYASGNVLAAGGAERYMWLLTRALVAHGWSATVGVWTALPPGERVRIDGVDFVGIERVHAPRAVYRFIGSEQPDWVHWFGASYQLGLYVAAGKLQRTRTVFSAQFDLDVQPRKALHGRPRLWPLYALGLAGSDKIFLQHGRQYEQLPSVLKSKACVVPGVVELPPAFRGHDRRDAYVAWVGVLRQPKRPDLLIDIARRAPSITFVVCGGASDHRSPQGYSDAIISRFKQTPNIHYLGAVSPARALEIIGGASLLLSTSDGEGFPSVFVEAWASGTPVVSLTIDPDGAIARHQLGRVCGGVERAVDDIVDLVTSAEKRQQIGLRCRSHVAQSHSSAAAAAIVERALGSDPAPALQPNGQAEQR